MDRPEHPLIESLRRAGTLSPYFDMPMVGAETEGLVKATDLYLGDVERLRHLVMTYGREAWGTTNNHVAGSAFIIAYLTRLVYPVIGQYVLQRRVPKVSLDNLSFHFASGRINATLLNQPFFAVLPDDPDAEHSNALVVTNKTALYQLLREWLFESNIELVIGALHRAARASVKVSQNAAAASCAQAFHRLYPLLEDPDRVLRDAKTFFEDPYSLVFQQVRMEVMEHGGKRGFFARRAGCCLVWRTRRSNGYCSNCILQPKGQQDQQFREMLDVMR
jgi:Ferric iron reductase FhuF-like transporter